jgi:hypothetical protein
MMQRLFETMINENESNTDHVHIMFEDRLICTLLDHGKHLLLSYWLKQMC